MSKVCPTFLYKILNTLLKRKFPRIFCQCLFIEAEGESRNWHITMGLTRLTDQFCDSNIAQWAIPVMIIFLSFHTICPGTVYKHPNGSDVCFVVIGMHNATSISIFKSTSLVTLSRCVFQFEWLRISL